jgi:hypothetical protein
MQTACRRCRDGPADPNSSSVRAWPLVMVMAIPKQSASCPTKSTKPSLSIRSRDSFPTTASTATAARASALIGMLCPARKRVRGRTGVGACRGGTRRAPRHAFRGVSCCPDDPRPMAGWGLSNHFDDFIRPTLRCEPLEKPPENRTLQEARGEAGCARASRPPDEGTAWKGDPAPFQVLSLEIGRHYATFGYRNDQRPPSSVRRKTNGSRRIELE